MVKHKTDFDYINKELELNIASVVGNLHKIQDNIRNINSKSDWIMPVFLVVYKTAGIVRIETFKATSRKDLNSKLLKYYGWDIDFVLDLIAEERLIITQIQPNNDHQEIIEFTT